ncbi:MAG: hypothetical protein RMK29_02405 [Myxococcales bacterium]|nr:hypothetical protein [Myxococcota bacterium]MDW8280533.1 hypothetical protein [Myxococcales bacterium]
MSPMRTALLLLGLGACSGPHALVPDDQGHLVPIRMEPVHLPGLTYLSLGQARPAVLSALAARGFDCSDAGPGERTQACVRPPGPEEPTGGTVLVEFEGGVLVGVQAHLQVAGDQTGQRAQERFDSLEREWTQAFGQPERVRRPGIVATRRSLRGRTMLLAVHYEGEPTLLVEQVWPHSGLTSISERGGGR